MNYLADILLIFNCVFTIGIYSALRSVKASVDGVHKAHGESHLAIVSEIKNSAPKAPKYRSVETAVCPSCGKHVAVFDPVSLICAHCLRK